MKNKSDILFVLSVIMVAISAIVSVGRLEFWLAGTQWMMIAIVLAVYALYFKSKEA